MHCPRCGHKQTSDMIRFCTKCGLAMNDVKEILVPELRQIKEKKKNEIGRGVRQGLALMLFGFGLVAVLAILRDLNFVPQVFVKIAALIFCVGGAVRMCSSYIFNRNLSPQTNNASPLEYEAETNALADKNSTDKSLPEAQYYPPINFGARDFDTAEMVQSPSITEPTTKLLEDRLEQK